MRQDHCLVIYRLHPSKINPTKFFIFVSESSDYQEIELVNYIVNKSNFTKYLALHLRATKLVAKGG